MTSSRAARICVARQTTKPIVFDDASAVSPIACLIASTTAGATRPKDGICFADRPSARPTSPSR
ncbi:hypothetical protein OG936_28455 [Streptomyces sp. NBC_00846]|uniref:hypothetical protein n=1 Tax=Streptomyces sp. NBC_00846 TaxID=2975849 RepID=UPI003866DAD9|nr:hypothetical protein OG936_28455 [Streptomyces sp. NBC_00846]